MCFVARACDCQNRAVGIHRVKGLGAVLEGWGKGVSNFDVILSFIMADSKTRRKSPTLKRKIEIIQDVENNPEKQKKTVAEEFGIAPSTLTTILGSKVKFKRLYFGGEDRAGARR